MRVRVELASGAPASNAQWQRDLSGVTRTDARGVLVLEGLPSGEALRLIGTTPNGQTLTWEGTPTDGGAVQLR